MFALERRIGSFAPNKVVHLFSWVLQTGHYSSLD